MGAVRHRSVKYKASSHWLENWSYPALPISSDATKQGLPFPELGASMEQHITDEELPEGLFEGTLEEELILWLYVGVEEAKASPETLKRKL